MTSHSTMTNNSPKRKLCNAYKTYIFRLGKLKIKEILTPYTSAKQ